MVNISEIFWRQKLGLCFLLEKARTEHTNCSCRFLEICECFFSPEFWVFFFSLFLVAVGF